MTEIILHHYALSPFGEKIRRILAYKRLTWHSVDQPIMMPKPDLTPLTGGYRRIPVLQLGADIYCDTACIARRLEELAPAPASIPPDLAGAIALIEDWADHRLFFHAMPSVVVALFPHLPPGMLEDRAAMTPALSKDAIFNAAPQARQEALFALDSLNATLISSPYLLGDAFTLADAACFHPLWFMQHGEGLFDAVRARPALANWYARIAGFTPAMVHEMAPAAALAIARDATPTASDASAQVDPAYSVGDTVTITAADYGQETVRGVLSAITAERITVRREDPRLGVLAVHFPRAGYRIERV